MSGQQTTNIGVELSVAKVLQNPVHCSKMYHIEHGVLTKFSRNCICHNFDCWHCLATLLALSHNLVCPCLMTLTVWLLSHELDLCLLCSYLIKAIKSLPLYHLYHLPYFYITCIFVVWSENSCWHLLSRHI